MVHDLQSPCLTALVEQDQSLTSIHLVQEFFPELTLSCPYSFWAVQLPSGEGKGRHSVFHWYNAAQ